ncbi:hypothetical protein MMC22_008829 [Lobaria immixta]|nr:hypothetical protein [Lobaria immixta]
MSKSIEPIVLSEAEEKNDSQRIEDVGIYGKFDRCTAHNRIRDNVSLLVIRLRKIWTTSSIPFVARYLRDLQPLILLFIISCYAHHPPYLRCRSRQFCNSPWACSYFGHLRDEREGAGNGLLLCWATYCTIVIPENSSEYHTEMADQLSETPTPTGFLSPIEKLNNEEHVKRGENAFRALFNGGQNPNEYKAKTDFVEQMTVPTMGGPLGKPLSRTRSDFTTSR